MRIPAARICYVAEGAKGRLIVIDCSQRLITLQRLLNGTPNLDWKEHADPTGLGFSDLDVRLQSRVQDCQPPSVSDCCMTSGKIRRAVPIARS
jgi:hypothetical protein